MERDCSLATFSNSGADLLRRIAKKSFAVVDIQICSNSRCSSQGASIVRIDLARRTSNFYAVELFVEEGL
jgi:hypothetical protein